MKYLISGAIALALLGSSVAFAQPDDRNNSGQNQEQRPNDGGRPDGPQDSHRHNSDRPHWSRGDRLPEEYRGNQYAVSDWRGNHLRRPPHGKHWVRVDDRFILVAIGTGLIVDVMLNH